jgi:hypothetical protein
MDLLVDRPEGSPCTICRWPSILRKILPCLHHVATCTLIASIIVKLFQISASRRDRRNRVPIVRAIQAIRSKSSLNRLRRGFAR